MIKVFLFDIDGTIANCQHRQHFVRSKPPNWNAFYEGCDGDTPLPTLRIFEHLYNSWDDVYLVSGRINSVREKTLDWIIKHTSINPSQRAHLNSILYMRPTEDPYTPDQIVKKRFFEEIKARYESNNEEYQIMGVFDDRNKVIRMWQENDVFVFNVNQTGEEF